MNLKILHINLVIFLENPEKRKNFYRQTEYDVYVESLIVLPLCLTNCINKFINILKIENKKLTWNTPREQFITEFIVILNTMLVESTNKFKNVLKQKHLNEYVRKITYLGLKSFKRIISRNVRQNLSNKYNIQNKFEFRKIMN